MTIDMKQCVLCGWDFPVSRHGDNVSGGILVRTIMVGDREVEIWECDSCGNQN